MAPTSLVPPSGSTQAMMNATTNGKAAKYHEPRIRVEEKLDKRQLDRLVTGVTVDTGGQTSAPAQRTEKASAGELRKGVIKIVPVENNREPRSFVLLTGLKTLFQKQLPKMPREYITRLVFDNNSRSLAIIKRGYKVVGGICFRPFPHRGFAEIVFFATSSVDQVKGYGAMLMDHFKSHIRATYPTMQHFLTYADNYAVGYFEKQGFSKEITLNRSVWAGYIKDYEGGTIMQCTMLEKLDYLDKASVIAQQKEAILTKIREMSRSHVVYDGLNFETKADGEVVPLDPRQVPGLRETGWTPAMMVQSAPRSTEQGIMERLIHELQSHTLAWAFQKPVSEAEVPDYHLVIKEPMDFSTMERKLDSKQYASLSEFMADAQLVFDNCHTYNQPASVYYKNATTMEKFLKSIAGAAGR
ncbi:histone acetyltransferase GCN5 [Pterulicium gracile]|uniref:histone acetyltransferase n=1 Tax=Pterulicium gracile TaxID=1884261 RepID=A0A5C3QJR3_9AGAR|nr:histone acetyltransferase GCN5 [Pterula gracilis]